MAWTTPMTAVANQKWTATQFNTHVRDNLEMTEVAIVSAADQFVISDGPNSLTTREIKTASTTTEGTTMSTSAFVSTLTGAATPLAVTCETGTTALVYVGARMRHNLDDGVTSIGVAISGETTVAASDARAAYLAAVSANNAMTCSAWELYTGLTPGEHTFTAQYKVSGGTGTYHVRNIIVIPF